MIRIEHVSKTYGSCNRKAVEDLSWEIADGQITGFIGPNGAGKTTTLKMITGITRPDTGQITINDLDILKNPTAAKEQFGFVSDTPDHFLRLKGIEYLNFLADIYQVPTNQRQALVAQYASRFGIADALGDRILSYSHGMRQKLMVIGALIHNPSVWILDEPLTGLDPNAAFLLKEMMKEHVAAGKSVLFSTHVLEVAEKLCDQVGIIHQGKLIFQGTLEQLKESQPQEASLEQIFLEMTRDA